jgi:hypothetical protein
MPWSIYEKLAKASRLKGESFKFGEWKNEGYYGRQNRRLQLRF